MGIEPTQRAWKARVLPLNYSRNEGSESAYGGFGIIFAFGKNGGEGWIRTTEGLRRQIYSLIHLAALVSHQFSFSEIDSEIAIAISEPLHLMIKSN